MRPFLPKNFYFKPVLVDDQKKYKRSSLFPTRTHATFLINEQKKVITKAINKISDMQTSWPNVNLFYQTGVALHTPLNNCSCVCCALLTVALN